MSVLEQLHVAAKARRRKLWEPTNGRSSSDLDVIPHRLFRKKQDEERAKQARKKAREDEKARAKAIANMMLAASKERNPEPPVLPPDDPAFRLRVRTITLVVCQYYGVSIVEVMSARRYAKIVRPRQVVMYLARELTVISLPQIGRALGGRDHTTVLHAWRKLCKLVNEDEHLAGEISAIKAMLTGTENGPR